VLGVTYIGHATLLIEIGGKRLLTDPNFDPALGKFLPRVSAPGIALDALPKLDAIVLTHAHADHLSFDSLDALQTDVPLFAPPAVAKWLGKQGYKHAVPLAPGDAITLDGVTIRAAAATHKGNRYGVDRWRSASNMYLFTTNKTSRSSRSVMHRGGSQDFGRVILLVPTHLRSSNDSKPGTSFPTTGEPSTTLRRQLSMQLTDCEKLWRIIPFIPW